MALYIGLDVGTTTLSTIVFNAQSGKLLARRTWPHHADATSLAEAAKGRAELDMGKLQALLVRALSEVVQEIGVKQSEVRGIGVTGQMHGVAFLDAGGAPLCPTITWQDRRALEPLPHGEGSYLARFLEVAGGAKSFERMGCLPAAGYLGPTLWWLKEQGMLPAPDARACFIPDAAVSFLTGLPPVTDPTDGGSSGIMDIVARAWDWDLIARLGLPRALFPEVHEPGEQAGRLRHTIAIQAGLSAETPVFVALGDNQASFLGSVRVLDESLLINVGTGSQLSALTASFQRVSGLDVRYFPGKRYLLVGAGLFGGRSYAYLQEFFKHVGRAFFGASSEGELYEAMNLLAAQVPPGADGLRCSPLFTGTRTDPTLRGSFIGLSPENLTPGHLIRALLEGMAEGFHAFYEQMRPQLGARSQLVGSGNGIRRNRLLAQILATRFGTPLYIPTQEEEAATGAALVAAVGAGEYPSLEMASATLQYSESIKGSG